MLFSSRFAVSLSGQVKIPVMLSSWAGWLTAWARLQAEIIIRQVDRLSSKAARVTLKAPWLCGVTG